MSKLKTVHDIGNVCEVEFVIEPYSLFGTHRVCRWGYSPWDGLVHYFHIFIPEMHIHYTVFFREIETKTNTLRTRSRVV